MVSYLETDQRALSAKWLRRLAPALKTTPGHLLDHDPADLPQDIVELWFSTDPEQRKQIARVFRAIANTGTDG